MKHEKPLLICLTPIKNEAWILDRFLQCVSLWADKIIISDQGSEDNSREIAKRYNKVTLIENPFDDYDEYNMRVVLCEKARKIKGRKVLIAMDADETFTPGYDKTGDWKSLLEANPGTVIKSKFVNIRPDMKHYWFGHFNLSWGFADDDSPYIADKIHTSRIVEPDGAETLLINDFYIMHYQYIDWDRMNSKQRWYQCWERINYPGKSPIEIFRAYHHMYSVCKKDLKKIPDIWFKEYLKLGIDLKSIKKDNNYYWDRIVLDYFNKYGINLFSKEFLWEINWFDKAVFYGYNNPEKYKYPRKALHKIIHFWLKKTQFYHKKLFVRAVDKLLKILFKW